MAAARADEADASDESEAARADEADAAASELDERIEICELWRDETEALLLLIDRDLARMVDFCDDSRLWSAASLDESEDSRRASMLRGELAGHVARFWRAFLASEPAGAGEKPAKPADATVAAARRETTVWPKSILRLASEGREGEGKAGEGMDEGK